MFSVSNIWRSALLVGLANSPVFAADGVFNEQDYLQEFPVVLSASRLSQPLSEAPNAMTVIDRNTIIASGFRTLPDLFKLVPGMYVSYYKGSQPIVSYHGSFDQYSRAMQVMIDGRSVYMPPGSTVDWASLPLVVEDIERIEVIRGPAAASYGANSVHGVISIITRDAGAQQGATLSIRRGNKGINDVSGQFGQRGENFDYRMTLAYTADNGYDDRTTAHLPSIFAADMNNSNDSNQARLMNYRGTYFVNSVDSLDVQLGANRDIQGVGFWDSHLQLNPKHDLISNASFQQLVWLHQMDNASELNVRFSHTRNATQENYRVPILTNQVAASKSVRTDRNAFEIQHTLLLADTNRLVYGMQFSQEQVADNVIFSAVNPSRLVNQLSVQSARLFLHDEWRFSPKLIVNLGAMYESDGGARNLSPRTSLNYHFTPKQTLRIGASVAYRTPSLIENYGTSAVNYQFGDRFVVGNSSLQLASEKILSREVGYLGEFDDLATSLDVRIFQDQFGSVIYPTATFYKNGLSGVYHGVETTIKHSFSASATLALNLAHEQAYSNVSNLYPGLPDFLTTSIPTNTVSALYAQTLAHRLSYSVAYYQQGAMQPFDRGIGDFQRLQRRTDVRLAKSFNLATDLNGDIAWVVQNLFKDNYTEYVASNVFNQRTYVTLSLHW